MSTASAPPAEQDAPAPRPRRHPVRLLATWLGVLFGLAALAGIGAHLHLAGSNWGVALGAFSPYLMALAPLGAVLLLAARRWVLGVAAGVLTAVVATVLAPTYAGDPAEARGPVLTVLTANVRLGQADPADLVAEARRAGADVVLLQELTPGLRDGLAARGLDELLPHSLVEPGPGADGIGLWSRFPLTDQQRDHLTFPYVSARLDLGAGRPAPTVLAFHAAGPWPQPADEWVRDMAKLPDVLDRVAAAGGGAPVLVGGDFNATWGNAQFRALLQDGYRDSAEQLGAQWTATYPADRAVPPLIGIDHLLVRGAGPQSLHTVQVSGSDHRGLVVRVALPG
ncbi:endonuclease/exonuclease/phosphatase family protein [Modestobacter sp. NPDC049651]|uniref:endonuclease/exonuclease/phosphatase family protein n=1 Tax=unclassified Modestobacter TaxID=2643866 RepID=UPI00340E978B